MKKQQYLFSHSAFFDILLQQKVRQVGLSETHDVLVSFTPLILRKNPLSTPHKLYKGLTPTEIIMDKSAVFGSPEKTKNPK